MLVKYMSNIYRKKKFTIMARPRKDDIEHLPELNKRLLEIIETKFGGRRDEFAVAAGIRASSLPNYFGSNPNTPTTNILREMKQNLPWVNLNWLITGVGTMFDSDGYGESEPAMDQFAEGLSHVHKLEKKADTIKHTDKLISAYEKQIDLLERQVDYLQAELVRKRKQLGEE